MQKSELDFKSKLKQAKKRMQSGYWTGIIERKNSDLQEAINNGFDTEGVDDYYKQLIKYDNSMRELTKEDSIFYQKVCEILDNEECILNPIELLIDKKYADSLNYNDRQRYIMKIGDKFRRFSEKYREEKKFFRDKEKIGS